MNGAETTRLRCCRMSGFYSSVILNGAETTTKIIDCHKAFYSSVILNGAETRHGASRHYI